MKIRVKISLILLVILCLTNLLPLYSALALKNSNIGKSEEKGVSHKFDKIKENNKWKINEIPDIKENSDLNQFDERKEQKMEQINSKEPHNGTSYEKIEGLNELMDEDTFESTWDTARTSSGSSGPNYIALPLQSTGTYDFTVEWGDSTKNKITSWDQPEATHYYDSAGIYTITITGTLVGWRFANDGDRLKILEIDQWGNMNLGNDGSYFYGCENLVLNARDAPNLSSTTNLSRTFSYCENLGDQGDMNSWDTSEVTNMSWMFFGAEDFNQPIDAWDTGQVTDMVCMLAGPWGMTSSFNQPIGSWNTSSVNDMNGMFGQATSFNQAIGSWNTSSVKDMNGMFLQAHSFNQPIGAWDTSQVTNMRSMFFLAYSFNQPIGTWDTSQVTDMHFMFSDAYSFNQPIGTWDTSQVTDMTYMFREAYSFNQPIGAWDTSQVNYLNHMFLKAYSFNQPIGAWDTSQVTDMRYMFWRAYSFNQPIGTWDTSQVTNMRYMLSEADSFDQDLGSWDVSSVTDFDHSFDNCSLSIGNYDSLLIGWSKLTLQSGLSFEVPGVQYSGAAKASRQIIISLYEWIINDGGLYENTEDPLITNVYHTPSSPTGQDNILISSTVTDNVAVGHVSLYYRINGGDWQPITMNDNGHFYTATIGPFVEGSTIDYYIYAEDTSKNNVISETKTLTVIDTQPPVISNITHSPILPDQNQLITIGANITDNIELETVTLYYRINDDIWKLIPMGSTGVFYSTLIGPFTDNGFLEYYIYAEDSSGNSVESDIKRITIQDNYALGTWNFDYISTAIGVTAGIVVVGSIVGIITLVRSGAKGKKK